MKTARRITILGRELSVRTSASVEKVSVIEAFVNKRLNDIGAALNSGDAQLVLMLALLNTAEELIELRGKNERVNKADTTLEDMILKLSAV